MRLVISLVLSALLSAVWRNAEAAPADLDAIAEKYVRLVLAAGRHDEHLVDAYHGPVSWQEDAAEADRDIDQLLHASHELQSSLGEAPESANEMETLRREYLEKQLTAIITRLEMANGKRYAFDEESRRLYDAVAPSQDESHFESIRHRIAELVPGDGPLAERVEAFRQQFVIPPERLETVFSRAIEACRERTLEHFDLPEGERFRVDYVNDKPWSGYNWYQGDGESLIQINTDLPIFIDRAVDLGCHEGYPGHHTYNALLEAELVEKRGWVEFTVYALFSPQSLIAEGSANFGIEMAFPGETRFEFELEVLMPLAGIDTKQARRYWELRQALKELDYAGNEAARRYLNGNMSRREAVDWLVRYTLVSPDRARQRVDFFDTYRSYVINYNHGKALVRDYVERKADTETERWRVFGELLGSPRLPGNLAAE